MYPTGMPSCINNFDICKAFVSTKEMTRYDCFTIFVLVNFISVMYFA